MEQLPVKTLLCGNDCNLVAIIIIETFVQYYLIPRQGVCNNRDSDWMMLVKDWVNIINNIFIKLTIIYIIICFPSHNVYIYLICTMQLQPCSAQHGVPELTKLTFTSTSVFCLAWNVESEILFHVTTDWRLLLNYPDRHWPSHSDTDQ